MGKAKPIKVVIYIGGKQIDTLTEEQRANAAEKISKAMSEYYTRHPEEYARLR